MDLTPERVRDIAVDGGTVLGTSLGPQDPEEIVDCLERLHVNVLFVVGGDGSMRGAMRIATTVAERGLLIAVVGVPKTIDNDIPYIDQSFGFQTAFSQASDAIRAATVEAKSTANGIGLVKLMGRHSGFIACYAALARAGADVVLIPEVPFALDGERAAPPTCGGGSRSGGAPRSSSPRGLAGTSSDRRRAATPPATRGSRTSASTCAPHLGDHFADAGVETSIRYIDPSYAIRSVPANPYDSVYCVRARAGRRARGDERAHRDGGRPMAPSVRAHPDGCSGEQAQPGRPARRPVDGGAGVHRPAGALRRARRATRLSSTQPAMTSTMPVAPTSVIFSP